MLNKIESRYFVFKMLVECKWFKLAEPVEKVQLNKVMVTFFWMYFIWEYILYL